MESKSIFVSKTFWINLIAVLLGVISITNPEMIGVKAETLLWVSGVLNIFLRAITVGPVSLLGGGADEE